MRVCFSLAALWPQKWCRVDIDSRLFDIIGLLGIKGGVLLLRCFKGATRGNGN